MDFVILAARLISRLMLRLGVNNGIGIRHFVSTPLQIMHVGRPLQILLWFLCFSLERVDLSQYALTLVVIIQCILQHIRMQWKLGHIFLKDF